MSNSNSIPLPTHGNFRDLTGRVFSRLTVLGYAGIVGTKTRKYHAWKCSCTCGSTVTTPAAYLVSGDRGSCGCLLFGNSNPRGTTHNMTRTPEYKAWSGMWRRCTNPKDRKYRLYKDRTPPPEWRSFERFLADVGLKPGKGFSLDRIDNDKPYGPGNCRWTTVDKQNSNKRNNRLVDYFGDVVTLTEACRRAGVPDTTVWSRLGRGESLETALAGATELIDD